MSSIKLKHSGGNSVSLNPPTSAPTSSDVAFKLPNADGSANQYMKTDGSGNLTFATVVTTEAAATPKVGSSSNIYQAVVNNITYNNVSGAQVLGNVSSCSASTVYAVEVFLQAIHGAVSASHGYLSGWYYQTGKTYNVDGVYVQCNIYNQYSISLPFTFTMPWDPSGTQSLSLYVTSSLNTSTNNYFNVGIQNKLENV